MLKRSGSKRISVDGQHYRYVVSEAGAAANGVVSLAVTVQHDQGTGARLRVTGLSTRRVSQERSKFYRGRTVDCPIRPRHVERLIRVATSRGWGATSPGRQFVVQADAASV